ncbi:chorismate mutase [Vogesella sp. XCS3]|nr:chorismate mutase [Vogesella sp. XCS3]UDM17363.1 chorismate mutase [Vogesella sp. XCS3]
MQIDNKLRPEQCSNMDDIRAEIDLLDRAVVHLIGQRYQYVLAAAKFKTSATAVRAPNALPPCWHSVDSGPNRKA